MPLDDSLPSVKLQFVTTDIRDLATMTARILRGLGVRALPSGSKRVPTRALADVLGHEPNRRERGAFVALVVATLPTL